MIWLARNWEVVATLIVVVVLVTVCSVGLRWAEYEGEARANATWELKALKAELAQSQAIADVANTYAQAIITREREWSTVTRKLRNEISKPVYGDCSITDDARLLHDAAVANSDSTKAEAVISAMPAPYAPD